MDIVILDTGCANFSSVRWAIIRLGYKVVISKKIQDIMQANKLLIPGVGTAQTAMKYFSKYNLIDIIKNYKKPTLGICLGLQLLGMYSNEGIDGITTNTLGVINTNTKLLQTNNLPLPHIGWNQISILQNNHFLFKGISKNPYFYFLHSFAMDISKYTIAKTCYGNNFTAILQKDNFFGVQFHPEKSSIEGSILLKNFLEI